MAGRNVTILGLPNDGAQAYTTFGTNIAGTPPAGLEAFYLGTEEPSERSRIPTLDPLNTQWLASTSGIQREIDGLSIVNHNFRAGSQVRFLGGTYTGIIQYTQAQLSPNAIASSTNLAGVVGNIDETISAPDGLIVGPSTTIADWNVRVSFPNFSPIPLLGYSRACFCLVVHLVSAGGDLTYPRLDCELWENGVKISSLGWRAVSQATQILTFPFDFASLPGHIDGRDLECKILATEGGTGVGLTYCTLDALVVYYETATPASGADYLAHGWDSGWIDVPGDVRPSQSQPTRSIHYIPTTPWGVTSGPAAFVLMVRADNTTHNPLNPGLLVPAGATIVFPDTYVQAGVWCFGAGLICSSGAKNDLKYFTPASQNLGQGQTIFGQTYAADEFRWRAGEPINLIVTRDELKTLQDQLGWRRGHSGAFYVALEPDVDISYQVFSSAWCTLISMSTPQELGAYRQDGQMLYTITVQFQEKL